MALGKHQFTVHDCKAALKETLESFNLPENAAKLEEARASAGNDMLKSMQTVFPAATQMQIQVIQRYGFLPDGEGLVQFTKAVRLYEEQDQEVRQLNSQLRTFLIPPVNVPLPVAPIMNQNGAGQSFFHGKTLWHPAPMCYGSEKDPCYVCRKWLVL